MCCKSSSPASGYVLKDAPLQELVRAIEVIYNGEAFFSPDIEKMMLNQYLAEARNGQGDTPARKAKLTGNARCWR